MDWTLEVIIVPVARRGPGEGLLCGPARASTSTTTRASAQGMRIVQLTPPGSGCSIVIGEGDRARTWSRARSRASSSSSPTSRPRSAELLERGVRPRRDPGRRQEPEAAAARARQRRLPLLPRPGRERLGGAADLGASLGPGALRRALPGPGDAPCTRLALQQAGALEPPAAPMRPADALAATAEAGAADQSGWPGIGGGIVVP